MRRRAQGQHLPTDGPCFENDVQGRLSKVQGQSERCWMMSPTLDLGLRTTFIFIGIGGGGSPWCLL